jgi:hypothetical protein
VSTAGGLIQPPGLDESGLAELQRAKALLENPGVAAKLASALGSPIERGLALLPDRWSETVHRSTEAALMKALDVAVKSLSGERNRAAREGWHRAAAAASGAVGGAFGLAALAVELPVSTTIMLRSIAEIARSEGEDLQSMETRLACLSVFALGGNRTTLDDAAESGYFAARAALASALSEASRFLAQKGFTLSGAPAVVRLIATLSARFGVVVSEKAAAQAIPVVGAAGGALINTVFTQHFQDMARGHFIVRRLEARHGGDVIRSAYEAL